MVAALADGGLVLVALQYLVGGVAGEQCIPAVGCGLDVNGVLVEVAGQEPVPCRGGGDLNAKVVPDAAMAATLVVTFPGVL